MPRYLDPQEGGGPREPGSGGVQGVQATQQVGLGAAQVGFALEQANLMEKIEQITQIANHVGQALNQAAVPEKMEQMPREVKILAEDQEHDAALTFAEFPWQQS